jgi:hypothetical protein
MLAQIVPRARALPAVKRMLSPVISGVMRSKQRNTIAEMTMMNMSVQAQ